LECGNDNLANFVATCSLPQARNVGVVPSGVGKLFFQAGKRKAAYA
jgi:hypothetical protein